MHVLAGINYNHQAPDEAAKLVRCFSCLKRRVAPTPPALARSTYETAGRSPTSSNRESTQHTIPRGVHSCSRPSTSLVAQAPHRSAQRARRRQAPGEGRPPLSEFRHRRSSTQVRRPAGAADFLHTITRTRHPSPVPQHNSPLHDIGDATWV